MRALLNRVLSKPALKPSHRPAAAEPAEPVLDPTLGDAYANRIRDELAAGEFAGAEALFASVEDPQDRTWYADVLSNWTNCPDWIDGWFQSQPSAVSHLIRGVHALHWAWQARGFGYGETVRDEGWKLFFKRLERAEANLQMAARLAPEDPTPWAFLIRAARGAQLGTDETRRRFDEARRRAPEHRYAHSQMLQCGCAKWGGSHEQMFEFARQAVAKSRPGGPLHVLVAEAHIERWLAEWSDVGEDEAAGYFAEPSVKAAISKAARDALEARFTPTHDTVRTRNFFAFGLWRCGERDAAAVQFDAIGPWVTLEPWSYLGDAVQVFQAARRECGAS